MKSRAPSTRTVGAADTTRSSAPVPPSHQVRELWIYEPCGAGHRLLYVRMLAVEALAAGRPVVLATLPATPQGPEFAVHLADLAATGGLRLELVDTDPDTARFQVGRRFMTEVLDRIPRQAQLVVPDGDRVLLPWLSRVGWSRVATTSFLVMRPPVRGGARPVSWIKRALLTAISWLPHTRVLLLTGTLPVPVSARPRVGRAQVVQDPVPRLPLRPRVEARTRLGLPLDRQVFLVGGVLDARKSIPLLLDVWVARSRRGADDVLLLAGQPSEEMLAQLDRVDVRPLRDNGHVVLRPGYLSDDELADCLRASDAVLLLHTNDGSSGLLGLSVQAGAVPIVGGSPTLVGQVRDSGIGVVCQALNPAGVEEAVSRVRGLPLERRRSRVALWDAADFYRALAGS